MAAQQKNIQVASKLLTSYVKQFTAKYKKPIVINRYKEKWAMSDVVESLGADRAQEVLDYYFSTSNYGHPLQWFYYNFENLSKIMYQLEEDKEKRDRLRSDTARRVMEWEERQSELRSIADKRAMQE